MKRDMDLVRDILLRIEDNPLLDGTRELHFHSAEEMGLQNRSADEVAYNFSLLVDAGFVDGAPGAFLPIIVRRLTWEGHEFLASIKSETVWAKTKERIKDLPDVALGLLPDIALAVTKQHFHLP